MVQSRMPAATEGTEPSSAYPRTTEVSSVIEYRLSGGRLIDEACRSRDRRGRRHAILRLRRHDAREAARRCSQPSPTSGYACSSPPRPTAISPSSGPCTRAAPGPRSFRAARSGARWLPVSPALDRVRRRRQERPRSGWRSRSAWRSSTSSRCPSWALGEVAAWRAGDGAGGAAHQPGRGGGDARQDRHRPQGRQVRHRLRQGAGCLCLARGWPGVEPVGLHMHIGSQITDLASFEAAYRRGVGCFASCARPASACGGSTSAAASVSATAPSRLLAGRAGAPGRRVTDGLDAELARARTLSRGRGGPARGLGDLRQDRASAGSSSSTPA